MRNVKVKLPGISWWIGQVLREIDMSNLKVNLFRFSVYSNLDISLSLFAYVTDGSVATSNLYSSR